MSAQDFKRKLTAVFSADVAGYSRLMGEDEAATVKTLEAHKQVMFSLIKQHRGRVIDSPGDNLLAEFASVVDAVQCGVAVQKELQARNADLPENRRMQFRIGINLGDVIEEGERIYGDGVNIAARLESLADPGGICVSKTAFDHIEAKLPLGYHFLGEQTVKNIAKPVGAYKVLMEPRVTGAETKGKGQVIPIWRRKPILASVVAVLIVIIGLAVWNFYWRAPKFEPASVNKMAFPLPDKPSIAVLPFDNISGDREQDYLADGMTENIISYLSKNPAMFVIDRRTSLTYKGKHVKVQEVSEDLGVRFILQGSVQKSGNKLRVTAQLVDGLKGQPLWSNRYDRDLQDLFALQDEITADVQKAMGLQLTGEHLVDLYGTTNVEAWGYMVREITPLNQGTKEGALEARSLCEKAAQLDPNYGYAWNQLAWTYVIEAWWGGWTLTPAEAIRRAVEYAEKEKATGKARGGYHTLMNAINFTQRKHDEAIAEGEKAIAVEPNAAVHYARLATALRFAGRPEEAIANSKKAMRLNPYAPAWYLSDLAFAYVAVGEYSEALAAFNRLLERSMKGEIDPLFAHLGLTITYARLGQMEKARAHAEEILKLNPKYNVEGYRKTTPFKDRAYLDDIASLLIKAGLPEKPPLPLPDKPSIAVLPFVNMSEDKSQDYFSDGLTEEIITALSKTPKLFVIARSSSFVYKGKPVNVQQVSRELGVKYVLEGSVRRSGEQLRITAQLIDATTGNHIWAERYDRELKAIFEIQDNITLEIMKALDVELIRGVKRERTTDNLEAFFKLLQANDFIFQFSRESNVQARKLTEDAIKLDPQFASAYYGLAAITMMDVMLGISKSPKESRMKAIELCQKATSLDDTLAGAYGLLGYLYVQIGEYEEGVKAGERAIEVGPSSAEAHSLFAQVLNFSGRAQEAIALNERAFRLNPVGPTTYYYTHASFSYILTGRYEDAVRITRQELSRSPNNVLAHARLVWALSAMGRDEEAGAAAQNLLRIDPKFSARRLTSSLTFKDPSIAPRYLEHMLKAGLPE